jgi:hypothetical protein
MILIIWHFTIDLNQILIKATTILLHIIVLLIYMLNYFLIYDALLFLLFIQDNILYRIFFIFW